MVQGWNHLFSIQFSQWPAPGIPIAGVVEESNENEMSLSWVHAEEEVKQLSQGPSRPCSEVREPRRQPGRSPPHGTIGQRPWQPAAIGRRARAQWAMSPISRADSAEHGHHQASSLPHHEGGMATSCPQSHGPCKCHCKTFTWALLPDHPVPSLGAQPLQMHTATSPARLSFHFQEMTRRDRAS